jgi:hypothetical protein
VIRLTRPAILPAAFVLVACAGPAPPSVVETVAVPHGVARGRVIKFSMARGLDIDMSEAAIVASGASGEPGWADCTLFYEDPYAETGQLVRSSPSLEGTRLTVAMTPDGGNTELDARASFTAVHVSRSSGAGQRSACPTTGVLERAAITAARGL